MAGSGQKLARAVSFAKRSVPAARRRVSDAWAGEWRIGFRLPKARPISPDRVAPLTDDEPVATPDPGGPRLATGRRFAASWSDEAVPEEMGGPEPVANPLWQDFAHHEEGPGIFKWEHYFDVYHRHLAQFVDRPVNVVEIGVYAGGSLGMWQRYFGADAHIYGVDIEPACRRYERDNVSIFIGDQQDRSFWAAFKADVPYIDVVIDDGGHTPLQQMVTLEELVPQLRPGGVYVCEDVHGMDNPFIAYASGLVDALNEWHPVTEPDLASPTSSFQRSVHSIHFYPYLLVIEKHERTPPRFVAPRHGSEWQPF